jgi:hypothetical protein
VGLEEVVVRKETKEKERKGMMMMMTMMMKCPERRANRVLFIPQGDSRYAPTCIRQFRLTMVSSALSPLSFSFPSTLLYAHRR